MSKMGAHAAPDDPGHSRLPQHGVSGTLTSLHHLLVLVWNDNDLLGLLTDLSDAAAE